MPRYHFAFVRGLVVALLIEGLFVACAFPPHLAAMSAIRKVAYLTLATFARKVIPHQGHQDAPGRPKLHPAGSGVENQPELLMRAAA
jgi:hypothetical protein